MLSLDLSKLAFGFLVAIAIGAASAPVLAQSGNIGGTIGKQDKTVSGSEEKPTPPSKNSKPTKRRAATNQSAPVARDSCKLVGNWSWALGLSNVVFKADRSTSHTRGYTGKWSCTKGTVVITWNHGVTDRGTLSDDGTTLRVSSSIGINFRATRK